MTGSSGLSVVHSPKWENYQLTIVNNPSPCWLYVTVETRRMSPNPDIAGAQSRPQGRIALLRTLRLGQAESAKHEGKQV